MRRAWAEQFPLRPDLVMFNPASFGLATTALLDRADAARRDIERDPNLTLGDALQARLDQALAQLCVYLHLEPRLTALTTSATAGAAAIQQSIPLTTGDVVIALDCEYSSVLRGWQRRCAQTGAELRTVAVPLPLADIDTLLKRMTAAAGSDRVAILQFSAVTSSAALQLPVSRLAAWGHERDAIVVVDAAHGPGHIDVDSWDDVDATYGTVHKWFPVPRSVGILWTAAALADVVRPAEVSLTWDSPNLARRFAWPGTFDPAARLCVPDAIATHAQWASAGELDRCRQLADHVSATLTELGAMPTAGAALLPPRLRAFLLDGVSAAALRQRLVNAGIRAWTGTHHDGGALLRIATHVYNDQADVQALALEVAALLSARTATR